jgi:RNA polymerase primary sigma factor
VEETKVDRVVRDLIADHDRLDGFLSKAHVERLIEKRQLTVEEGAEVYRKLDALGISVEEESENLDETEGPNVANAGRLCRRRRRWFV